MGTDSTRRRSGIGGVRHWREEGLNHTGDHEVAASGEGIDTDGEEEDTNLDDQLRENLLEVGSCLIQKKRQHWGSTTHRGGAVYGGATKADHGLHSEPAFSAGTFGISSTKHCA